MTESEPVLAFQRSEIAEQSTVQIQGKEGGSKSGLTYLLLCSAAWGEETLRPDPQARLSQLQF